MPLRLCPGCGRKQTETGPCRDCRRQRERIRKHEPNRMLRRSRDWQKVRALVVRRDRGACTQCGRSDTQLEVHHIVPLRVVVGLSIRQT